MIKANVDYVSTLKQVLSILILLYYVLIYLKKCFFTCYGRWNTLIILVYIWHIVTFNSSMNIHRRLSLVTLPRYAALCTLGPLVRKISYSWIFNKVVSLVLQGNHCGKLDNEMAFYIYGLVYHSKCALVSIWKVRKSQYDVIAIEEYLIVTCNFIGRRLVSLASWIFMKTIFCQSNCPQYIWSVTEESTVVADNDEHYNRLWLNMIGLVFGCF